jgi:hypothetical protein
MNNDDTITWEQLEELRQFDQLLKQIDAAPTDWLEPIAEHATELLESRK